MATIMKYSTQSVLDVVHHLRVKKKIAYLSYTVAGTPGLLFLLIFHKSFFSMTIVAAME
jgi:hypothetical protein